MKITIASGKGGTGKTFIATNLAWLLRERGKKVTYIDCDVEAPNGHLFLKPQIHSKERVTIGAPTEVDEEKCIACGKCVEACLFNAIALIKEKVLLFPELCHACGGCSIVCPTDAIIEGEKEIGTLLHGRSENIEFHYGLLKTAVGGMSPRLIRALKDYVGEGINILDSPPGTACSAVETVKGADVTLLVTDPTPFAVSDLRLSVNMARTVGQEPAVIVNRAGLDDSRLKAYCEKAELEIIGEIPDDRRIAEVYSVGDIVVEKIPAYIDAFEHILEKAEELAGEKRPAKKELIEPLFIPGGAARRPESRAQAAERRAKEIVVISGKGGTGKTSLVGAFAALAHSAVISDCDVDAADLYLILQPEIIEEGGFSGGVSVEIDQARCTACGKCKEACRFGAVELTPQGKFVIDQIACEGCGVCALVCEDNAIKKEEAINGKWFLSRTRFGKMSHAILGFAEENTGRLVTLVREMASQIAQEEAKERVLIDGSPGTGCPVIASITGAKYACIVTEPTVSGEHDLGRILDVTRHFGVKSGVIVNKADLNPDIAQRIKAAAQAAGAEILGYIPYDENFTRAQIEGLTLIEYGDGESTEKIEQIWERIKETLSNL